MENNDKAEAELLDQDTREEIEAYENDQKAKEAWYRIMKKLMHPDDWTYYCHNYHPDGSQGLRFSN